MWFPMQAFHCAVATTERSDLHADLHVGLLQLASAEIDAKDGDPPGQRVDAIKKAREADVTIAVVGDSGESCGESKVMQPLCPEPLQNLCEGENIDIYA
jgi:hypothetical protein